MLRASTAQKSRDTKLVRWPLGGFRLHDSDHKHAQDNWANRRTLKANRFDFQHLRDIFAEMFQLTAAVRASCMFGGRFVYTVAGARAAAAVRSVTGSAL